MDDRVGLKNGRGLRCYVAASTPTVSAWVNPTKSRLVAFQKWYKQQRHYSDRRQSAGCIRRMRSVGKKVAASAIVPSSAGATKNVTGS